MNITIATLTALHNDMNNYAIAHEFDGQEHDWSLRLQSAVLHARKLVPAHQYEEKIHTVLLTVESVRHEVDMESRIQEYDTIHDAWCDWLDQTANMLRRLLPISE